jgi:hypothetical protein
MSKKRAERPNNQCGCRLKQEPQALLETSPCILVLLPGSEWVDRALLRL